MQLVRADLPGDRDHGCAVQVGVRDTRHQVRGARPEGCQRYGAAARQPAVDVGHERRALFVAGRDVADATLTAERVQHVHRLLARHGEHVPTALCGKALDEEVSGCPRRAIGLGCHSLECTVAPTRRGICR